MQSCSSAFCILILLISTFTTGSHTGSTEVKVKLHESATLPCSATYPFSGEVKWIVEHDPFHILAQCNQTSCQSKEGFQIFHHQYLKGNLSLSIIDVDLRKRTSYTCQRNGKEICNVALQIEKSIGPSVRVKRHQSATLPCHENYTSLATWISSYNTSDVLAQCNQTSCHSVKEGFQMIHDHYLKGDLSLIIIDADFSKRDWYTCQCDHVSIYDVQLQIEPLSSSVQMKPNESLVIDLDIVGPVEVIYNSTGAPQTSGQVCTVDGRSPQCGPKYAQRVSPALELREMKLSDSGVYIIQDAHNKDVIHIYSVTVQDDQPRPDSVVVPLWLLVLLIAAVVILLVVLLITCVKNRSPCRVHECFQMNAALLSGEGSISTE